MSINPIEDNSTPKPTGSLEDLFRHHLGEEAAVPTRPMLWEQIDNSLLTRQNETYRRRLAATRWVAAASLLLATLAGTGWWAHRAADMASTEVAMNTRPTGSGAGFSTDAGFSAPSANGRANSKGTASNQAISVASSSASAPNGAFNAGRATANGAYSSAALAVAATSPSRNVGVGAAAVRKGLENSNRITGQGVGVGNGGSMAITPMTPAAIISGTKAAEANAQTAVAARTTQAAGTDDDLTGAGTATQVLTATGATTTATAATAGTATSTAAGGGAVSGAAAGAPTLSTFAQSSSAALPEQVGSLATNSASLALPAPTTIPSDLATVALPADAEPIAAPRKWKYGASFTAAGFNPNINFSRVGIEPEYGYNPALGADSPALTEAAAAQYRENLRPGLSQRIALVAKRHLAGHWSLSTGAEFTQANAKSASNTAFLGEQLLDLGPYSTGPLRTTDFRYRMAGIPVEVSYSNPAKRGWSLYGRLGGVVSALLGVRSEVEGSPEATRTYSIASAGTPYRRVLGSLRGSAGAQFRAGNGNWALSLGPVAELGLVPLNAHPAQSYLAQSRPYSFGVEAGVEFGK